MPNTPNQAKHLCLRLQLLLDLTTVLDALQYALTILVELQLRDDNLRGMNAHGDGLAGGLVLGDTLDVDDIFKTVHGGDLSFTALVGASDNKDFIVFADRDRSDLGCIRKTSSENNVCTNVVLLTELLAQRCAHDCTSDAGWGIVMSLA